MEIKELEYVEFIIDVIRDVCN